MLSGQAIGSSGKGFQKAAEAPGEGRARAFGVVAEEARKSPFWVDRNSSIDAVYAKRHARLPTVLTRSWVRDIIEAMSCSHKLMAQSLCWSGLRLMEGLPLRVKDVDSGMFQILVRDGKGQHYRTTMLTGAKCAVRWMKIGAARQ